MSEHHTYIELIYMGDKAKSRHTDVKWSINVTCPSFPLASRFAYSAFLIECIETASVMVSTSPDCEPVISIRKLGKVVVGLINSENSLHVLFHPTTALFFCPDALKLANKLHRQLFLSQITTSLDNDRNTFPVDCDEPASKI